MEIEDYLDEKKYENDEKIHVYKALLDEEIGEPLLIPDSIFNRISFIGKAYNLHYLSFFEPYKDYDINKIQMESLLEELNLIFEIVNDDLLKKYVIEFLSLIKECINSNENFSIKILGY